MFVGEPKRLSEPFPDPFSFKISNMLILGWHVFVIAGNKASLRLGSVDLCDCWHQGVIQAEQPRLVQGADAVNVEFGDHLSW